MKKEFFNQMLTKLEVATDVEILTEPEMKMLKGGGCTCKKTNSFICRGYNDNRTVDVNVDVRIPELPKNK